MVMKQANSKNDYLRLGKAPAKRDPRNLQLRAILRKAVKLPTEYDFDLNHPNLPTPMFGNDTYGCCVIAGRAHQTLRFELVEQKKIVPITTAEVTDEYFSQSDGEDSGLVMLTSIGLWRKRGWIAGKKRYVIRAYSEVDRTRINEVKTAIFMNLGVGIGLRLPSTAEKEIQAGKPWTQATGAGSKPGSWGGHYVYVTGYTKLGPTCVTWGRKQQMSWAFFSTYCDEAYAIIDAFNTTKKRAMLDERKLAAFLTTVSKPKSGRKSAARKSSSRSTTRTTGKPAARKARALKFGPGKSHRDAVQ